MRTCNKAKIKRSDSGLTLMELIIACGLTAIIALGVCGVYFYMHSVWRKGQAISSAYSTTLIGMERIESLVAQAYSVSEVIQPNTLTLVLPQDTDDQGRYVPVRQGSKDYSYRAGTPMILYLSDETGGTGKSGSILWRAVYSGGSYVPDADWSMIGTTGQVGPMNSMTFSTLSSGGNVRTVNVTLTAGDKHRGRMHQVVLSRTIRVRNCDR